MASATFYAASNFLWHFILLSILPEVSAWSNCAADNASGSTWECAAPSRPGAFSASSLEDSQTLLGVQRLGLRDPVALPIENFTRSFWLEENPLAEEGSTGPLTSNADVCIIGSGITGVSTAWHLSKMLNRETADGLSVVILEAREFCSGATGRNGGNLTPFLAGQFSGRTALEAVKSYRIETYTTNALVNFVTQNNLEEKVDLVQGGHVTMFKTEADELDARREWEEAKTVGLNIQYDWLSNQHLIENYGLNRHLNYTGVYFQSYNLWPLKLVTHLLRDSQSASGGVNVTLHTKTPVTSMSPAQHHPSNGESDGHPRWNLYTHRGDISCTYVVHATNGYASHLLTFLSGTDDSAQPSEGYNLSYYSKARSRGSYGITPHRGQVGAVRASVNASGLGWINSWGFGGYDSGSEYWFPRYQGTESPKNGAASRYSENPVIILGGGRQTGISDDSVLNSTTSVVLRSFLPELYPDQFVDPNKSSPDTWEKEWTGIMGYTKDGDPFVGPVVVPGEFTSDGKADTARYDGQYIAAGFSGHGMPRTYACAQFVADMIASRIRGERWIKPSWIPERYLTWATDP